MWCERTVIMRGPPPSRPWSITPPTWRCASGGTRSAGRRLRAPRGTGPVQVPLGRTRAPLRLRLVAIRKSPGAAEQARRQARQAARRHGHTVSAATLEAAAYVLLLTTLSLAVADATEVLELYRLRWPIECAFKRLKSLIHLDALRAFDPALAQTYLLAKLLGALLVEDIQTRGPAFSPYGYPPRLDVTRYLADYPDGVARPPDHHRRAR